MAQSPKDGLGKDKLPGQFCGTGKHSKMFIECLCLQILWSVYHNYLEKGTQGTTGIPCGDIILNLLLVLFMFELLYNTGKFLKIQITFTDIFFKYCDSLLPIC